MPVVVVESPAKAKTINKYLGSNYTVLASYGHVRDLPPKDGSVLPEEDFDMKWEIASDSKKHIRAIVDALKDDNELILATDPDREGEAISWHLTEALIAKKAIKKDTPVSRVVFNAITKTAVTEAMKNPRQVDVVPRGCSSNCSCPTRMMSLRLAFLQPTKMTQSLLLVTVMTMVSESFKIGDP